MTQQDVAQIVGKTASNVNQGAGVNCVKEGNARMGGKKTKHNHDSQLQFISFNLAHRLYSQSPSCQP